LADDPTNGNYVGNEVIRPDVPINNGLFTVALDFGPAPFDGSALWLEIGVRTNGSLENYTILEPLQPLTSVPYAAFANSSARAGLAANLADGAVLTNVTVRGSSIESRSITANQMDPATDAAYRAVDTNTINAIIADWPVPSGGGATPHRLDVKHVFGAKGDGVTDDTAVIQSGLNYLSTASASNLMLYFPPGIYKLLGTLSLPTTRFPQDPVLGNNSGYRLSGGGLSATKLVWPSISNGIGLALTNVDGGYEGVIIEDLTLVGPLMSMWDAANTSIGLAIGKYGADTGWSGFNNTVRNCGLIGWAFGAAVTNQWTIVFDNCVVKSNRLEGLRFAGSHGVSVQNCRIGGGWSTACGIGVGFHPPMNAGYGDNAQIVNCMIGPCTNGIVNSELNLVSLNNNLEQCGSYYTLLSTGRVAPATTIIGGYTLDYEVPWTKGFAAQMLMDSSSAANTILENPWFTSSFYPSRKIFKVTNDGSGYAMPIYIGPGSLPGLWNSVSNVTLFPFGNVQRPATIQASPASLQSPKAAASEPLTPPLRGQPRL
jgi:hypothetical protein